MKAGFGREEIRLNLPISHIWSRLEEDGLVREQLDPLFAHVIAWREKDIKGTFITLDVLAIPYSFTKEVRRELKDKGFNSHAISITATHSHTTPTFRWFRGCPKIKGLREEIKRAILKAIEEAEEDMEEAELYWGKSECDINVNRRQIGRVSEVNDIHAPSGDVDKEVVVLKFKRKKGDILLINYSAHPITITKNPLVVSADYPGKLVEYLERQIKGTRVQFLQGACGNQNVKIHGDQSTSELVGKILGEKVKDALKDLQKISGSKVKASIERIKLPLDIQGTLKDLEREGKKPSHPLMKEWVEEVKEKVERKEVPQFREAEVQKISLGEFTIVFLPGEPFMEIGKKIKEMGAKMVVGYTNIGEAGYIPTQEAFKEGGYEVDNSYRWYDTWKYSPDVEKVLLEGVKRVMEVKNG